MIVTTGGDEAALKRTISIAQFIRVIERLPSDQAIHDPRVWYTTQKEHWLGWLHEYDGPGAYGRIPGKQRDAKFAYNHIVEPKMLLWLIEASKSHGTIPFNRQSKKPARPSAGGTSCSRRSRR